MFTVNEIQGFVYQAVQNLISSYSNSSLHLPVEYALSVGGKRLRPVLCLMTYNMFCDNLPPSVLKPALGLEIYHNFTLVHDDVMDHSDMRRNQPTIHKKWNVNTAILSGDALCMLAYKYMSQCNPDDLPAVLEVFNQAAEDVCEGQQLDMDYERQAVISQEEYLNMISRKTGALIACAMQTGAICAKADPATIQLLKNSGYSLGAAFQVQDDYLDVYGDQAVFGKSIGLDICNNKKTWLLTYALRTAQGNDLNELNTLVQTKDNSKKVPGIIAIYNKIGVKEAAEKQIADYLDRTLSAIEGVNVKPERKVLLMEYIQNLLYRNK